MTFFACLKDQSFNFFLLVIAYCLGILVAPYLNKVPPYLDVEFVTMFAIVFVFAGALIKFFFYQNDNKMDTTMDLQSFIGQSVTQVMGGIREAQNRVEEIEDLKQTTKADNKNFKPFIVASPRPGNPSKDIYDMEFDVAVTVSSELSQVKKGKIFIAQANLNMEEGLTQTNTSVNRMKFSIPVIYPSMPKPQ